MNKPQFHQIIFNRVPHANGTERSITFQKECAEDFVTYQELFEFLEERTGIPKKHFIICVGKREITYVDVYLAYYTSYAVKYTHYIPAKPHDSLNVRLHLNVNYQMYKYYTNSLKTNMCDATYLELLKFADDLFKTYYTSNNIREIENIIQCYSTLQQYQDNFKLMSPFKQFSVITKQQSLHKKHNSLAKL